MEEPEQADPESEWLYSAVQTLPPVEAYLIRRVYLDGVDAAVVARVWMLTERQVAKRLRQAVKMLKSARTA